MIVVPYFVDTSNDEWHKLHIFLRSGGRELWSAEGTDKAIQKMLNDNGFPVVKCKKEQGVIYAQIDNSKLQMNDFYTWDEIDPEVSDEDVWRTFLVPNSLWTCPVFKEFFWKTTGLPSMLSGSPMFTSSSLQSTQ
jgi:hypothetical protein